MINLFWDILSHDILSDRKFIIKYKMSGDEMINHFVMLKWYIEYGVDKRYFDKACLWLGKMRESIVREWSNFQSYCRINKVWSHAIPITRIVYPFARFPVTSYDVMDTRLQILLLFSNSIHFYHAQDKNWVDRYTCFVR